MFIRTILTYYNMFYGDEKMAYIVDTYNKWDSWDRKNTIYRFMINDMPYAIKKVELDWGMPSLPFRMEE